MVEGSGELAVLSREQARRIAIRAQLLDANRPDDVVEVVEQLHSIQLEPTAAIAPSADLILWSRIGADYEPDDLITALEVDRSLFELALWLRPMADLPLQLAAMGRPSPWLDVRAWLEDNAEFVDDVLELLAREGPMPAREIPDTSVVDWQSSGWTQGKNVQQLVEFLGRQGRIAVSGRRGNERLWDLASRVFPADVEPVPYEDAVVENRRRFLRGAGIAPPRASGDELQKQAAKDVGVVSRVEGVRGLWRVDPDELAAVDRPFRGRVALLSPFDRLVADRNRLRDIFEFDYLLEMFKPKGQRRWGYFALPILAGDRLVGKLDATADRRAGVLRVTAVHEDVAFDSELRDAVDAEIAALASWLELRILRA